MADAALYRFVNASRVQQYRIAKTTSMGSHPNDGSITLTASPWFPVSAEYQAINLMEGSSYVHKMGQTSGWTWGQVFDTCVHTTIFGSGGSSAGLLCQYGVKLAFRGGDSGGPVFLWNYDGSAWLVGIIVYGGPTTGPPYTDYEAYFSPIEGIKNDMSPFTTWQTY
ncbi:MAG: hypothetical protein AB1762_20410 [Gemmatimonadota bacterium]